MAITHNEGYLYCELGTGNTWFLRHSKDNTKNPYNITEETNDIGIEDIIKKFEGKRIRVTITPLE